MSRTVTVRITDICKSFENFVLIDEDRNHYYISEADLLKLLPDRLVLTVEKKRTRTWVVSVKSSSKRDKKVDHFEAILRRR